MSIFGPFFHKYWKFDINRITTICIQFCRTFQALTRKCQRLSFQFHFHSVWIYRRPKWPQCHVDLNKCRSNYKNRFSLSTAHIYLQFNKWIMDIYSIGVRNKRKNSTKKFFNLEKCVKNVLLNILQWLCSGQGLFIQYD